MSRAAQFSMAGGSDAGRARDQNEDRVVIRPDLGLAVLADGMGGHQAGEVASAITTDTIVEQLAAGLGRASPRANGRKPRASDPGPLITAAIEKANSAVHRAAQQRGEYRGMGATVVVALVRGDRLYFAHAGDSRLYRLRGDVLEQLTQDHSLVQDLVARGLFTAEEARRSPAKHVVTRALGVDATIAPELGDSAIRTGDAYLLCSDGLTDVVEDEEIGVILAAAPDPATAVQRLVDRANVLGGPDNISVVVLRFDRKESENR